MKRRASGRVAEALAFGRLLEAAGIVLDPSFSHMFTFYVSFDVLDCLYCNFMQFSAEHETSIARLSVLEEGSLPQ